MNLQDMENEDLAVLITAFTDEELMEEQERCQEVIDLHVMAGGIDLTYWYNRVNMIEQTRWSRRQAARSETRRDGQ